MKALTVTILGIREIKMPAQPRVPFDGFRCRGDERLDCRLTHASEDMNSADVGAAFRRLKKPVYGPPIGVLSQGVRGDVGSSVISVFQLGDEFVDPAGLELAVNPPGRKNAATGQGDRDRKSFEC